MFRRRHQRIIVIGSISRPCYLETVIWNSSGRRMCIFPVRAHWACSCLKICIVEQLVFYTVLRVYIWDDDGGKIETLLTCSVLRYGRWTWRSVHVALLLLKRAVWRWRRVRRWSDSYFYHLPFNVALMGQGFTRGSKIPFNHLNVHAWWFPVLSDVPRATTTCNEAPIIVLCQYKLPRLCIVWIRALVHFLYARA